MTPPIRTHGNAQSWRPIRVQDRQRVPGPIVSDDLPSTANVVVRLIGGGFLVFACLALIVGTISVLTPERVICGECR
jgi:hypothetical protein